MGISECVGIVAAICLLVWDILEFTNASERVKHIFSIINTVGLLLAILIGSGFKVHAAPSGYDKYGELAEEVYQDDLGLLACTVWAEAGNQDLYGKELVVDVILNRVDSVQYPNTIREVIFDKYQFSTTRNGALDKAYYNVTQECYTAVANELLDRNDSEALFFCAGGYGYGTPMYKYGDHYFSK